MGSILAVLPEERLVLFHLVLEFPVRFEILPDFDRHIPGLSERGKNLILGFPYLAKGLLVVPYLLPCLEPGLVTGLPDSLASIPYGVGMIREGLAVNRDFRSLPVDQDR